MISKADIAKMAKHIFKRTQSVPDRRLMHPKREWGIMLMVWVIVLTVGIALSADRFLFFLNLEQNLEDQAQRVVVYKVGTLSETLEFYRVREQDFASIADSLTPAAESLTPLDTSTITPTAPDVVIESEENDQVVPATSIELSEE